MSTTIWKTTAGLGAEGPNGNVMPHRVLEWMQDAAANASVLGGYPPDRYRSTNCGWFVKEIALAIDRPIRYRDEISVETWISDVRRFRSHRECRLYANGELAARARTEWLLLESRLPTAENEAPSLRVRPRLPDAEMIAAFPVRAEHAIDPSASEIPAWSDAKIGAVFDVRDTRTVQPTELDRHEHVNHVVYLAWLEDHARNHYGHRSELKFVRLEYASDAKIGDGIAIEARRSGDRIEHRVTRNELLMLRSISLRAF